jgi:acyl-coenzyme A synthetase/AMP-(fatty) acid ligase
VNHIEWQLAEASASPDLAAIVWRDRTLDYGDLVAEQRRLVDSLRGSGIAPGDSVGVIGDYSPVAIATLLALLELRAILVPLSRDAGDQHEQFFGIAELDHLIDIDDDDRFEIFRPALRRNHELLDRLRTSGSPGLILFSSGSSGEPKAIVHDLEQILVKFRKPRHRLRTVNFLLFDHIGGVNTMFYTLANLGCTVIPRDRSVARVCEAIDRHRVELLPTSPSFLNLLLFESAHSRFALDSLQLITYGTEVMPERTLKMANAALPHVRFQQTYGLSEVGIMRSKSASNDSLMVKIGGEDYQTRVVDGTLRIRARTSMLGYLNAPDPFDADGWFDTGDAVIQEGEYYRILGRESDLINVGGQKVYPTEVEKVLAELPGVIDVAVSGEEHLLLGQIVVATLQMDEPVAAAEMRQRVNRHCRGRLQAYMIPQKVRIVDESPVNYRYKKIRR